MRELTRAGMIDTSELLLFDILQELKEIKDILQIDKKIIEDSIPAPLPYGKNKNKKKG